MHYNNVGWQRGMEWNGERRTALLLMQSERAARVESDTLEERMRRDGPSSPKEVMIPTSFLTVSRYDILYRPGNTHFLVKNDVANAAVR